MGTVHRKMAKVISGLQSKVLPPMSPKVVTEEEVNRMVTYHSFSVRRLARCPCNNVLFFQSIGESLIDTTPASSVLESVITFHSQRSSYVA